MRLRRVALVPVLVALVLPLVPATASGAPQRGTPPPAFGMPMDAGPRLLAQRAQAEADLAAVTGIVPAQRERVDGLRRHWEALEARLAEMDLLSQRATERLTDARDRVQRVAADAYKRSVTGTLGTTMDALSRADDVLDLARDLKLLGDYGSRHDRAIEDYTALRDAADSEVALLTDERTEVRDRYLSAQRELEDAQSRVAGAQQRYDEAVAGLRRFHQLATHSGSPIVGPSYVTAEEMAAFVQSRTDRYRLTVPLRELAQHFLDEGATEGIRGDVAFAQSILETGWFRLPDHGLVHWTDNNYAGIGACDSCEHGFRFETAQRGVRAQIQALKIYVTPKGFGPEDLVHESEFSGGIFRLGFRGQVQSWWDLTGRWATAADYGNRLYDIYAQMVDFALARRSGASTPTA